MRLMTVMPAMASYRPQSMAATATNAPRMAGFTLSGLPSFEVDAALIKQLRAKPGKPIYRRLGDDKVLSFVAEDAQVADTKYSLRATLLGTKPGSYYQILILAPDNEHGNTFRVSSAKDVVADQYAPLPQLHTHVPTLLKLLKEGREIDTSDFMDVTDGYNDVG